MEMARRNLKMLATPACVGIAVALLAVPAFAAPPAARAYRVTYLTSSTVYIDAGREDGLDVGARVEVVRTGEVIATLRVSDVSTHRAACAIETSTAACAVGDAIRFTPVPRSAEAVDTAAVIATLPAEAPPPDRERGPPAHGIRRRCLAAVRRRAPGRYPRRRISARPPGRRARAPNSADGQRRA